MHGPPHPYGRAVDPTASASGAVDAGAPGFGRPRRQPPWTPRIRHVPTALPGFVPDSMCSSSLDRFAPAGERSRCRVRSPRPPSTAEWRRGRRVLLARRDAHPRPWRKTRHVAGVDRSPPACLPESAQAERRVRPLARRAERIARPARVRIRSRKPWVFERRRLFGWKVRLLTSGTPSSSCSPHAATMCRFNRVNLRACAATSRSGCHRDGSRERAGN
jgi:hypothetical protein